MSCRFYVVRNKELRFIGDKGKGFQLKKDDCINPTNKCPDGSDCPLKPKGSLPQDNEKGESR